MERNPAMNDTLVLLIEPDPWRAESLRAFLAKTRHRVATEEKPGVVPDLVLLNISDRPTEARSRVERLRLAYPAAKIVAFVREVDSTSVFPCLLLGVKGVVSFDASPKEIEAAFETVLSGSIWSPRSVLAQWIDRVAALGIGDGGHRAFTRAEHRVLDGLREELSNKEIARRIGVTEATVKFHVTKLLKKTGTRDRRELSRFVSEVVPAGMLDHGRALVRQES